MKFSIDSSQLRKELNKVNQAIDTYSVTDILKMIKITVDGKGLYMTGTGDQISVMTEMTQNIFDMMPGNKKMDITKLLNVKEPGTVVVSSRSLLDIVKRSEADTMSFETQETNGFNLVVYNGTGRYVLKGISPLDFPNIAMDHDGQMIAIEKGLLYDALIKTGYAVSKKESSPAMTGINLDVSDGVLTVTATDSKRIARKIVSLPDEYASAAFNVTVPQKGMVKALSALTGSDVIDMYANQYGLVMVGNSGASVKVRLIMQGYPDVSSIFRTVGDSESSYSTTVSRERIRKALLNLESVAESNISGNRTVILSFNEEGSMTIRTDIGEIGYGQESLEYTGDIYKKEVRMNMKYLEDAVNSCSSPRMTLTFFDKPPVKVTDDSDPNLISVVMPTR